MFEHESLKDMKSAVINGKMYDVTTLDRYAEHRDIYGPNVAIIEGDYIYPIKPKTSSSVGVAVGTCAAMFTPPETEEDKKEYTADKVIDFSDVKNMRDLIATQNAVRDIERDVLTTPGNLFKPHPGPNTTPEMAALQEAVCSKNIDINKYEHKFPNGNFNNDKRMFDKDTISMGMLKRACNALDIKCTITLEDKSPDVPNPMGKSISVELTGGED